MDTNEQNSYNLRLNSKDPTPRSKKKVNIWMISTLSLLVASILLLIRDFNNTRKKTEQNKQIYNTSTQIPTFPPKKISATPTPSQKANKVDNNLIYLNSDLKFGFRYPKSWQIKIVQLSKGQEYKDYGEKYTVLSDDTGEKAIEMFYRIQAKADDGNSEFIVLTRNKDWQLTIQAQKEFNES